MRSYGCAIANAETRRVAVLAAALRHRCSCLRVLESVCQAPCGTAVASLTRCACDSSRAESLLPRFLPRRVGPTRADARLLFLLSSRHAVSAALCPCIRFFLYHPPFPAALWQPFWLFDTSQLYRPSHAIAPHTVAASTHFCLLRHGAPVLLIVRTLLRCARLCVVGSCPRSAAALWFWDFSCSFLVRTSSYALRSRTAPVVELVYSCMLPSPMVASSEAPYDILREAVRPQRTMD